MAGGIGDVIKTAFIELIQDGFVSVPESSGIER